MTDTLTRATDDASEALGMDVRLYYSSPGITTVHIGAEHKALTGVQDFGAALAYLEGLETGARIMRERYRPLVEAMPDLLELANCVPGCLIDGCSVCARENAIRERAAEALANLEA